jgi:hypothetical protein
MLADRNVRLTIAVVLHLPDRLDAVMRRADAGNGPARAFLNPMARKIAPGFSGEPNHSLRRSERPCGDLSLYGRPSNRLHVYTHSTQQVFSQDAALPAFRFDSINLDSETLILYFSRLAGAKFHYVDARRKRSEREVTSGIGPDSFQNLAASAEPQSNVHGRVSRDVSSRRVRDYAVSKSDFSSFQRHAFPLTPRLLGFGIRDGATCVPSLCISIQLLDRFFVFRRRFRTTCRYAFRKSERGQREGEEQHCQRGFHTKPR